MDSIFEKYLGDIKAAIPINRILLFGLAFLVSVLSHDELRFGAATSLLEARLSDLSFESGRVFRTAMIADVFWGAVIVLISWGAYIGMSKLFINRLWIRLKLDEQVAKTYAEYDGLPPVQSGEKLAVLEYTKRESDRRLSLVKKFAGLAELMFGLAVLLSLASLYTGVRDAMIAAICFPIAIASQVLAIIVYLRRVLPYELHASALSGLRLKLGMLR